MIATETGMCIYDPASQSLRSNVFPEGFVHRDKVRTIYEDAGHNLYFIREKGSLFTSTLTMDRFQNRLYLFYSSGQFANVCCRR